MATKQMTRPLPVLGSPGPKGRNQSSEHRPDDRFEVGVAEGGKSVVVRKGLCLFFDMKDEVVVDISGSENSRYEAGEVKS
ncbi:MAG: hypothetical protein JWP58_2125 [Hymenobacter sp.]|nr:hypothetical protein [Hymenobacter sp.]